MSGTVKIRKKPVEVEAMQFTDIESASAIIAWAFLFDVTITFRCDSEGDCRAGKHYLNIQTLEGDMTASPMDWIIKGVKNEFYPCKPDIMEDTYEKV